MTDDDLLPEEVRREMAVGLGRTARTRRELWRRKAL